MKEFLKKAAAIVCFSALMFACEKDGGGILTTLTLDRQSLDITLGETAIINATLQTDDPGIIVEWTSNDVSVAVVDQDGKVYAINVGNAVITAKAGEASADCKVTVSGTSATSVTLDKTAITLILDETATITATVNPINAVDKEIKWSSSDTSIATVEDGEVTAVGAGEATITAMAGSVSAYCSVVVLGIPKIGDYYYEDGTWSDGGLQSIEADGLNPVWANPKPAPITGKTVVGIIFQTNPDRLAVTDKEKGFTHGYAVAVKNAHSSEKPTVFYTSDYNFASTPQAKIANTWYTNINGYNETMKVIADYGANINLCPAFDITVNSFSLKAPDSSSGWFLPSTGQLWDMAANLCGNEVAVFMKQWQTSTKNVYQGYNSETVSYDVIRKFNETISMIPDDQKEELFSTHDYWNTCTLWATTCFDPGDTACVINLGGSEKPLIELMCEYVDYDGVARPIIAF